MKNKEKTNRKYPAGWRQSSALFWWLGPGWPGVWRSTTRDALLVEQRAFTGTEKPVSSLGPRGVPSRNDSILGPKSFFRDPERSCSLPFLILQDFPHPVLTDWAGKVGRSQPSSAWRTHPQCCHRTWRKSTWNLQHVFTRRVNWDVSVW